MAMQRVAFFKTLSAISPCGIDPQGTSYSEVEIKQTASVWTGARFASVVTECPDCIEGSGTPVGHRGAHKKLQRDCREVREVRQPCRPTPRTRGTAPSVRRAPRPRPRPGRAAGARARARRRRAGAAARTPRPRSMGAHGRAGTRRPPRSRWRARRPRSQPCDRRSPAPERAPCRRHRLTRAPKYTRGKRHGRPPSSSRLVTQSLFGRIFQRHHSPAHISAPLRLRESVKAV